MPYASSFTLPEPARTEIDGLQGAAVLEFGTDWCGFCRGAIPLVKGGFDKHPGVQHLRVEDGSGRKLGRSFSVKLWPTLVFLKDGQEVTRLVRPGSQQAVLDAMAQIDPA